MDAWQQTCFRIAKTECRHSPELMVRRANQWASMDVCDKKCGGCGAIIDYSPQLRRVHREKQRPRRKQERRTAPLSVRELLRAFSTEEEKDNVCPRCDREFYVFRTVSGQIMRCRRWDLAGTPCTLIKMCRDRAVNPGDKNTNRTGDGGLATGRKLCQNKAVAPKTHLPSTTGQLRCK